jgi:hypothetical protein
MAYNKNILLLEKLLALKNKKYNTKTERLSFERGYLLGLIASVMSEDFVLRRKIQRYLDKNT